MPPADLAAGPHTLEFSVRNISHGSLGFGGLVHFELSEALPSAEADGVATIELSAALRFPSSTEEYALHRAQRDALLAHKARLTELPGDCTAFIDDQFELCYWQHHRGDPTSWGNPGYEELGPDLWTAFTTAGNAIGYGMGAIPRCRLSQRDLGRRWLWRRDGGGAIVCERVGFADPARRGSRHRFRAAAPTTFTVGHFYLGMRARVVRPPERARDDLRAPRRSRRARAPSDAIVTARPKVPPAPPG